MMKNLVPEDDDHNNDAILEVRAGKWCFYSLLWSIKGHTQMPLKSFNKPSNFYCIKQIDCIFPCACTVIDHRRRHSV